MAKLLRSISLRSLPCSTVKESEPGPDDNLLVIQANVDQRIARQALANVHEFARRNGDLAWLGGLFKGNTADQFDFEIGTGQRQLLSLHHKQYVGQHRQGLTALNDASNQLQGFQQGFALNGEMHGLVPCL